MSCTKIKFLQLTLLIALALTSCKKENLENFPEKNPTPTTDQIIPVIDIKDTKFLPTGLASNEQLVLDMEENIRNIFVRSLFQTVFYPEVYGLQGGSATTRTGCPCSTLVTASNSGGQVHTITLDYGTGCGTVGDADYEGIITLTLNGDLNVDGTTVLVQLDENFKLNSINDMDGTMNFTYEDDGTEMKYNVDNLNLQNTNTSNGQVTEVNLVPGSPGLNGQIILKPNTVGDLGDALDFINDTLAYNGCFIVDCPTGESLRSCTTQEIFYSIPCGTPFDGEIVLDTLNGDGTYGAGSPLLGTFGNMDFAYPNSTSFGVCDSLIQFTDADANTSILNL